MDKQLILETLKKAKETSPKRNFKQAIDLIMVLRGLDLKKPEQNVNTFLNLHHGIGRKISVCALVGAELIPQAKEVCDEVISDQEFDKYKVKKDVRKLAEKHDYFIAQANIMPKIATVFGRVFGPKGKMPNPKAGCVVPPNANLKPVYERLQKLVRLQTKNQAVVQNKVGIEDQNEDEVADNILTIYNAVKAALPQGDQNIKSVMIKLTMSPAVKIGKQAEAEKK